jgi:hypothetical protein
VGAASIAEKVFGEFVEVTLEAGGDHHFDLRHLRAAGTERLLQLLLRTAGYRKHLRWRVRMEKKLSCGPETRAITVVGSKPWCCYLKIKSGDNNTAHFCSLLMPDGFQSAAVYEALKDVEDRINAAWRHGFEGEAVPVDYNEDPSDANGTDRESAAREAARLFFEQPPAAGANSVAVERAWVANPSVEERAGAAPAVQQPAAEEDGVFEDAGDEIGDNELLGWNHDREKVRLTLLAIQEVGQEGKAADVDDFVAILSAKLGWQGLRRRQIGGIFRGLTRRGHIYRVRERSRALGYGLTAQGQGLIKDLLPADFVPSVDPSLPATPVNGAPPTDPGHLAAALSEAAHGYAAAYQKLQVNQARRDKLLAELKDLEAEAVSLNRVVGNPEVQALLAKLLQLTGSPMAK